MSPNRRPAFTGFPSGKVRLTPIPAPFFTDLLPSIDHLGELKVSLYAFWYLDRVEGSFRFLRKSDFEADSALMAGLGVTPEAAAQELADSLERAALRGTLLRADLRYHDRTESLYFLNSARGRAAINSLGKGDWRPDLENRPPLALDLERPNIFRLYEENIGPLTPMIAEALRDAEITFPQQWIEEALRIAVENNIRRWRYVEAILRSWQEEGRDDPNRGDSSKDRRRYIEGRFAEFIEH
ncbi:MAG TPA: DnaD domain protein [Anaerolineaceae bacterium]